MSILTWDVEKETEKGGAGKRVLQQRSVFAQKTQMMWWHVSRAQAIGMVSGGRACQERGQAVEGSFADLFEAALRRGSSAR